MTRRLIEAARALTDRFRGPGGRPPSMGGAVPVDVRVPAPPAGARPARLSRHEHALRTRRWLSRT